MPSSRWFQHQIRVRYHETDQMGIVYHTNYVNWMEWGRTELIREAGMPYERVEKLGLMLPIVNLQVHFKQSAKYDEIVTIWTRIKEASALRMAFEYEIKQEDRLLVTGSSEHVWIASDYRPIRLDKRHPELFNFVQQLTTEME